MLKILFERQVQEIFRQQEVADKDVTKIKNLHLFEIESGLIANA